MKHTKVFDGKGCAQGMNECVEKFGVVARKDDVINIDHEVTNDVVMLVNEEGGIGRLQKH